MSRSRSSKAVAAVVWFVCVACSSGQRTNVAPSLQLPAAGSFNAPFASGAGARASTAGSGSEANPVKPGSAGSSIVGVGGSGIGVAGRPGAFGGGGVGAAGVATAGVAGAGAAAMNTTAAGGGSAIAGAGAPTPGMPGTDAPPCTGKPGMKRGKSNQMVMAGGTPRTYVYYAPMTVDPNKPVPLVVVPHGFTMSGEEMFGITGYDKVADRDGFVVAYPDGEGASPWNCGDGICGLGSAVNATGDDQSFMNELIKQVESDQCLDRSHIFMSGFSMGGYFSNETACSNPLFRAAGPHSGGTHDLGSCKNMHRPMIIFHFKSDALIDYSCGSGARDNWVKKNGCMAANPDVTPVIGGSCEYYKGCPPDGQVAFCSFDEPPGGAGETITGHAWSGGSSAMSGFAIPQTESATELGWAFFKKYAW